MARNFLVIYMETIFQLENGTKWAFYEDANQLFLQLLPITQQTGAKPLLLADDYLHSMTGLLYNQKIYYAYHTLSHAIKLGIAGNEFSTIVFSDSENTLDCRQIKLIPFQSTLYLSFLGRHLPATDNIDSNTSANYDIYLMDVLHERLPYTVITNCAPTTTYQIINMKNITGILLSDKKNSDYNYYQSNDMLTFVPMHISPTPVPQESTDDIITKYEKQISELKEEYKTLYTLCEKLQKEGKYWREKYYRKK